MLSACSPAPRGPYFGDEHLLVAGVDTDGEADAVTEQLTKNGHTPTRRLRGFHFIALGFADKGGPAHVRVVTPRGIALSLNAVTRSALHAGVRYDLLEAPLRGTHDADGDEFEEIFVLSQTQAPPARCILVFRVRDSGFVDAVGGQGYSVVATSTHPAWRQPLFCGDEENTDGGIKIEPADAAIAPHDTDSPAAPEPVMRAPS